MKKPVRHLQHRYPLGGSGCVGRFELDDNIGMVRKQWCDAAPYVSLVVIVAATITSAISFALSPSSAINGSVIGIVVVTAVEFVLVLLLSPYMGKKEFLKRFGTIPKYWNVYRRNKSHLVCIAHLIPCLIGVLGVIISSLIAQRGTSLVHTHGYLAIISPSGVESHVSSRAYSVASAALLTVGPMGALLIFQGFLLMYLAADRFLSKRPELWPPANIERRSAWFGTFPRGNARS